MNTYMHVTDNMQQTVANAMGNLIAETENKQKNKLIHFSAWQKAQGTKSLSLNLCVINNK